MAGVADDPRTDPKLVIVAVVAPATPPTRSFVGVVTARMVSDLEFRVFG